MLQQPCKDIQRTLEHITNHIEQVVTLNQNGTPATIAVSKMETPSGAYTFRLCGICRPVDVVTLIKRAIGEAYVHKSVERGDGTVDVVIMAEAFDRDTFLQASNMYEEYERRKTINSNANDEESDDSSSDDKYKKKRSSSRTNSGDAYVTRLTGATIFVVLLVGMFVVGPFIGWMGWFKQHA